MLFFRNVEEADDAEGRRQPADLTAKLHREVTPALTENTLSHSDFTFSLGSWVVVCSSFLGRLCVVFAAAAISPKPKHGWVTVVSGVQGCVHGQRCSTVLQILVTCKRTNSIIYMLIWVGLKAALSVKFCIWMHWKSLSREHIPGLISSYRSLQPEKYLPWSLQKIQSHLFSFMFYTLFLHQSHSA